MQGHALPKSTAWQPKASVMKEKKVKTLQRSRITNLQRIRWSRCETGQRD